jgi:hypothetical protein
MSRRVPCSYCHVIWLNLPNEPNRRSGQRGWGKGEVLGKNCLRTRELLLFGSGGPTCPLADLARADITVATEAEDEDDTESDGHPRSPSSVCARTSVRQGSKLPAPPTRGKLNVWLSELLSAPSLSSTSDMSPRRTAGELGCGIRPRTSSILDRNAPPMP